MALSYDPRSAVVVVDGTTLPAPRLVLYADPRARAVVEAAERGLLSLDADIMHRMRVALLGGNLSVGGKLYPRGARGCFHEGCDGTTEPEEGGSHWCRLPS